MKQYIEKLKQHIADNPLDFGDANSAGITSRQDSLRESKLACDWNGN